MRVERVKRWQWFVLSVLVGLALAYAFRADVDNLPSRLGEGVADQRWFERQVQRRVTLADGSTVPALGRLTVYPLTIQDRTGRRPVHVVAGMFLAQVDAAPAPSEVSDAATRPSAGLAGKLRPYFFIAPVPYTPLAAVQSGRPAGAGATATATVRAYLDGLRDKGVTYTYAWWADARYATAAWVAGSVLGIGLLWPTAVNLIAFGTFRAPAEAGGINLWKVKASSVAAARPAPVVSIPQAAPPAPASPATAVSTSDPDRAAPHLPVPVLAAAPAEAAAVAGHEHKEFGTKRDDFYPTELRVHPHKPVAAGPDPAASGGGRHDE